MTAGSVELFAGDIAGEERTLGRRMDIDPRCNKVRADVDERSDVK